MDILHEPQPDVATKIMVIETAGRLATMAETAALAAREAANQHRVSAAVEQMARAEAYLEASQLVSVIARNL